MTHSINYTADSDSIDLQSAKAIMDAVLSWADGQAQHFDGVTYDNQNDGMRISVRITGVEDIGAKLSDLDSSIQSINSNQGSSFPLASDVAKINPEQ